MDLRSNIPFQIDRYRRTAIPFPVFRLQILKRCVFEEQRSPTRKRRQQSNPYPRQVI